MMETITHTGALLQKKQPTPGYILFYLLFSPETWRVLFGILASYFLTPLIAAGNMPVSSRLLLHIMLAAIGFAGSGLPARWIAHLAKQAVLGNKRPGK